MTTRSIGSRLGGIRELTRRAPWKARGGAASPDRRGGGSEALVELARSGPAPLEPRRREAEHPSVAVLIPSFRRGSGGHRTIVRLAGELARSGHPVSLWLEDCEGRHAAEAPQTTVASFQRMFDAEQLRLHADLSEWAGADVVLATGWQTVARALLLPGVGARAYLVQDHEPDFYPASAQAVWAAQSYRMGLHCICASPWLAQLLRTRYGASANHFDLAVDHDLHRPTGRARREDLVLFYARAVTPRRAVPLGMLALEELSRRVPGLQIALFGDTEAQAARFTHRHLGVLDERRLAALYGEATVGMVLSLTNPSLIGLEMMACGLPCVELASDSMLATFGADGPPTLARPDPLELCTALERLLGNPQLRAQLAQAGIERMRERTWARAGEQLREGLEVAIELSGR